MHGMSMSYVDLNISEIYAGVNAPVSNSISYLDWHESVSEWNPVLNAILC